MATLTKWDSTKFLKTEEEITAYLDACFEEAGDDPAFIAKAIGNVARARGMTQLAVDTGLSREGLYRTFSGDVKPEFSTILKVLGVLGYRLQPVAN